MSTTELLTQPDAARRRALLAPIVGTRAVENDDWLAHIYAAICWSYLTEPGDLTAGNLTGTLGYAEALEHVVYSSTEQIVDALNAVGVTMPEEKISDGLKRWRPRWNHAAIEVAIDAARRGLIRVLTSWDEEWPEGFDRLGAAGPHVLWVKGDPSILHLPAVALVGARAATSYGERVASDLASSSTSHVVVSGGAYGIDGAAHRAALAAGGKTVAYLAGGVDRPYPMGHANLLDAIATTGGAVVSEIPPGHPPTKWRFLQRNRLVAAHAEATIVIEAGFRSGSLNTAGHAQAIGRKVGAVPGPITSAASAGCHRLLREFDATCITGWDDVKKLLV